MEYTLEQLAQQPIFARFFDLCRHPHPSHGEKPLSDFLLGWARGLGLEAVQDGAWNVIVKKPASPGYEDHPPVLLQAHIDMVCQKEEGVEHNFATDPIQPVVEGRWLTTGGRTTLGADNGVGAAYMMAVLEDTQLAHPPIEAVFTTAEEDDFSGAIAVDGSRLSARTVLNLDFAEDDAILCGSSGGNGCEVVLPAAYEMPQKDREWYAITLTGLPGGHSAADVNQARGSAATLLTQVLQGVQDRGGVLADIRCGDFRLAIPRSGTLVVGMPGGCGLVDWLSQVEKGYQVQYQGTAPGLILTAEGAQAPERVLTANTLDRLLNLLYLTPNGIFQMNSQMPAVVESSDNLGEIRLEEGELKLVYEIRATYPSSQDHLNRALARAAGLVGAHCRTFSFYPSWHYQPDAPLLATARRVYREQFGEEPRTVLFHAGLEVGYFMEKLPGAQAIALSPNMMYCHSPKERVEIPSMEKSYRFLTALLATL